MRTSALPFLSAFNGPGYLLHAVEALSALGLPAANTRLLPVIGHALGPEVAPYEHDPADIGAGELSARLEINVRDDSRLRVLLPLLAVGMPSPDTLAEWEAEGLPLLEGFARQYLRLGQSVPDWTNAETPAERLARQLCDEYPGLRDPGRPRERLSGRVTTFRQGKGYEETNRYIARRPPEAAGEPATPHQAAQDLVETFFTQALLAITAGDLLGGFEFVLPMEPEGRDVGVVVEGDSAIEDVVRWLHAYPHRPKPTIAYDAPEGREREAWEAYFRQNPDRDNIFETAPRLWTEQDPAVETMYRAIREGYEAGRSTPMSPDELLTLARRCLPEYLPHYPRQIAVTGGLNLEGTLLGLIGTWLRTGPVLGMDQSDWERFAPHEQVLLCALLAQRRHAVDPCALFEAAVRLLVHAGATLDVEAYQPAPTRLGRPLAQLRRAFVVGGVPALHAPEMVLHLPLDRGDDETEIEARVRVAARLFLPAHVPLRCIWQVDWFYLGKSAYLGHGPDGRGAGCRLPHGMADVSEFRDIGITPRWNQDIATESAQGRRTENV
jgi:hypothetical protein